jgi:hypothetical protein
LANIFVVALLLAPLGAGAGDLLQFAQKYQDRYASEFKDKAAFEQQFIVRTKVGRTHADDFSYDDARGIATVELAAVSNVLGNLILTERCKNVGRELGVTGFGVKVPFTRLTCHRVFLQGYSAVAMGEPEPEGRALGASFFRIKLSPAEFRRLKAAASLEVVVALTVTLPETGVVVRTEVSNQAATREYPYETHMNVYYVHGTISELKYFLPGAKAPFSTQTVD